MNAVATQLSGMFDPDANIIFGATVDEAYGDELTVTIVATDFVEEGFEADRFSFRPAAGIAA